MKKYQISFNKNMPKNSNIVLSKFPNFVKRQTKYFMNKFLRLQQQQQKQVNMNHDTNLTKLKNYYSFGKNTILSNQNWLVYDQCLSMSSSQSKINDPSQFSYDLSKDFDGLNLQIIHTQQTNINENIHNYIKIEKSKFFTFIQSIKSNLTSIKQSTNKIKQEHSNFTNIFSNSQIFQQQSQNKNKDQMLNYKNVEQSLRAKFSYHQTRKSKALNKIENIMSTKANEIFNQENNKISNNCYNNNLINQIKLLKTQINSKTKQILFLKKQLNTIKNQNNKKQSYFFEMMKIQQLQWNRKVKSMSGSTVNGYYPINKEIKQSRYSENKPKRVWTEGCQKLNSPISTLLSNMYEMHNSLNIEIQTKTMKRSDQKISDSHKENDREEKIVERQKKSKDRKKSTDSHFQRVYDKIKTFQSTIRK